MDGRIVNRYCCCGLPWWLRWWRICLQCRRPWFSPWVGEIAWKRKWQLTPVFVLGEFHGQRSLEGYSPWGHKESDTTEQLTHNTAVGNSVEFPPEIKNKTAIWSSNVISGYLSKENENTNLKRYIHTNVHWNIIYDSQDVKANCLLTDKCIKKMWRYIYIHTHTNSISLYTHVYNKILLSHQKWTLTICDKEDGSRRY